MQLVIDNSNHDIFLNTKFSPGSFLQSGLWRDWLSKQGKKYWQLVVLDEQKIVATCLLYENKLLLGHNYLYAPKGPFFSQQLSLEQRKLALDLILSKVRDVTADTSKSAEIFFKLDLPEPLPLPAELIKSDDIQPRDTWVLDLNTGTENILAQMHPKTRYNINLAERKGVKTEFSQQEKDIEFFLELITKTAVKNQISVHSANYYRGLWQTLLKNKSGDLCIARIDGQPVAANIVVRFGQTATYLHGASDYKFRAYMAPHLLQWDTIRKMKECDCTIYDFWGVAPADGSKPKWEGFSRFKKSFGGRLVTSPGAHSIIYDNSWFGIYRAIRKMKSIIGR